VQRCYVERAPLDLERVALGQSKGNLPPGVGHDALKRRARYAHVPGCFFLGQPLQIGQAQRL
jgi:hypothetical protein